MQSVMMLFCWQWSSTSVEWWLSWPSRINNRYLPFVRGAVWWSKCLIQSRPTALVVQPLLVVAMRQSAGRLHSVYQLARWYCAAKMMKGGMAQPRALTPWITVRKGGGCTGVTMLCDQMPIGPAAHLLINSMSKVYDVSQITSHHCFPR